MFILIIFNFFIFFHWCLWLVDCTLKICLTIALYWTEAALISVSGWRIIVHIHIVVVVVEVPVRWLSLGWRILISGYDGLDFLLYWIDSLIDFTIGWNDFTNFLIDWLFHGMSQDVWLIFRRCFLIWARWALMELLNV